MKNKILMMIFLMFVIFLVACKQTTKQQTIQKTGVPAVGATGDAAVDTVGKDLNNVDNIEKDLNTDQLTDMDAGLQDIQKI